MITIIFKFIFFAIYIIGLTLLSDALTVKELLGLVLVCVGLIMFIATPNNIKLNN